MGNWEKFPNSQTGQQESNKIALLIQLKTQISNLKTAMKQIKEYLPNEEDDEGIPLRHKNSDIIQKLAEIEKTIEKFIENTNFDSKYLEWLENYLVFRVEEFFAKIKYYVNPPIIYVQNALFYIKKILPAQLYTTDEKKLTEQLNNLSPEARENILKLKSSIEYISTSLDKLKLYLPRHNGLNLINNCNLLLDDLNFVLKHVAKIPVNAELVLYAKTTFQKIILFLDELKSYYKSNKMVEWIDKIIRTCKFSLVIINKFIKQQKNEKDC